MTTQTTVEGAASPVTMETLVAFCKRKGFIFQASEIYGGLNGFFDFGPLGVELKNNIKQAWWHDFVHMRDDMVGLDSTIIQHPRVWEASGHVANFTDPMVDCKESKLRYRADHLMFSEVVGLRGEQRFSLGYISFVQSEGGKTDFENLTTKIKELLEGLPDTETSNGYFKIRNRKTTVQCIQNIKTGQATEIVFCNLPKPEEATKAPLFTVDVITSGLKPFTEAPEDIIPLIPSPATGKPGSLTAARKFNMMFKTHVGALEDSSAVSYLRPETAQGIFTNFKNVLDTGRVKIPFGIAQVGKAFRNEITPRNFIFRSREFEQMEIEYFISDDENSWQQYHNEWVKAAKDWYISMGVPADKIHELVYEKKDLAHYSRATTDLVFDYPFGRQELMGIAARGNFDLTQHGQHSGKPIEYFDETQKRKYTPHVIEPSWGVDRALLAILLCAYAEDTVDGEKRVVLRLKPRIAPYKAAIFPLLKNKPELTERATKLYNSLRKQFRIDYDESGAIGKRYRRQDEIGTPYGITVDFQTLEDGTVTVRDRDTTKQERLPEAELANWLAQRVI